MTIDNILDDFFSTFDATLDLTDRLVKKKENPQDIVLLLCARLDALASAVAQSGSSSKAAFVDFIVQYAGDRPFWSSVSAGDLYCELDYHKWLMEGLISKPGRVTRFSRVNDPVIRLLDVSGIPLTVEDSTHLIARLARVIRQRFHVAPRQKDSKPATASVAVMETTIRTALSAGAYKKTAEKVISGLHDLLAAKTVVRILYERYRNDSVHGAKVLVDDKRFFADSRPYWRPMYSEFYGPFQLVEFPAKFLQELLRQCMNTLRLHLSKQKLPPDVVFHATGQDVLDYAAIVDDSLLPETRELRLKLPQD